MRNIITLLLLLLAISCFGQRVISLEKLAKKEEKSDNDILISDHTIDGRGSTKTGYYLIITGTGTRALVFKNFHGVDSLDQCKIIFIDATINNGSDVPTIKGNTNNWYFSLLFERSFINGKPGNNASALIIFDGPYNKGIRIEGDGISTFDQKRNGSATSTNGGPMFQIAGTYASNCNASNWNREYSIYKNLICLNSCDELIYDGYNDPTYSPKPTGTNYLLIDNVHGTNLGRDGFQFTSVFKKATIKNSSAINGGLENNKDHVSGFSINGDSPNVEINNVKIEKFKQFAYSRHSGAKGGVIFKNCTYIQGDHVGTRANSAMYLVGSSGYSYTVENTILNAPSVTEAAITSDGGTVYWKSDDSFFAPKPFRYFNSGRSQELALVKNELRTYTVETSTLAGVTTTTIILSDGTRIPLQ